MLSNLGIRIIPISLSGYTGEAAERVALRSRSRGFDITTMTKLNTPSAARMRRAGEGRLQDKLSKATLLAKAYTGDNTRAQASRARGRCVLAILKIPGIARPKLFSNSTAIRR
jgi:hypothetical protein